MSTMVSRSSPPSAQTSFDLTSSQPGKGDGCHSFRYRLPARFRDGHTHCLRLRFAGTREDLACTPRTIASSAHLDWISRQAVMDSWYRDISMVPSEALRSFSHDYTPLADRLAPVSGTVLDLGGGLGVTRHYLLQKTQYIVLEPSLVWLSANWTSLSSSFPCPR